MKSKRLIAVAKQFGVSVSEMANIIRTIKPSLTLKGPNTSIDQEVLLSVSDHFSGRRVIDVPDNYKPFSEADENETGQKTYDTNEIPEHLIGDSQFSKEIIELINDENSFLFREPKILNINGETIKSIFTDFEAFTICGGIDNSKARYISRQYFSNQIAPDDLCLAHKFSMDALEKYGGDFLSFCICLPPVPFKSSLALKLFAEIDKKQNRQKFPVIRIVHKNKNGQTEKLTLGYYTTIDENRNRVRHSNVLIVQNKSSQRKIMSITRNGDIIPEKGSNEIVPVINLYLRFTTDPQMYIINYGFETGECSICGRELTDPESIKRGIGPICNSYLE